MVGLFRSSPPLLPLLLSFGGFEVLVTYANLNLFHDGIVTTRRQLDRSSEWDVEEDDSTVSSLPSLLAPCIRVQSLIGGSDSFYFRLLLGGRFGGRMYQQRVVTAGIVVVLILLILLILWIKFFR